MPFTYWVNGAPHTFTAGQLVDESDPACKGREIHFEYVETHVADRKARVEQATAAPGERRSVTAPAKRKQPRGRKPQDKSGDAREV